MKASPRQQRILLDLQDLDNTLARLRRKRTTLPERAELAGLSGDAADARTKFMAAQRELDTQNADLERIEADVALVQQRRDRDEQLLAASTSSKEAQALQSELETLTRRKSELEDRELELMEVQERALAAFASAEQLLAGVDARRTEIEARLTSAEQRIDRELASNAEERAGLAAELQRDILGLYEELRARIGIGAARLRGNVSEASNMALAPAELSDIRAAAPDELVFCPGTGAILVRVDEE
ncbi:zinc ribbon domain-containing protein [Leucobacter sp. NPDC058333]|uniref:zinc ribbon domain-containing protein n=1 Tax=Leucobacter sp. NPDC058333 TaxID=3346450 RepID=UPI00366637B8